MHILQNSKFQRRRKRVKLKEKPAKRNQKAKGKQIHTIRNLGKSKGNSITINSTNKINTLQLWQRSLANKEKRYKGIN
uniref:MIP06874p n=1 Tax=Drosophila melanogaster TaxID=7227 RepID=C0PV23_DROME|nr:MIP06874p [Drosophila melanogaster]